MALKVKSFKNDVTEVDDGWFVLRDAQAIVHIADDTQFDTSYGEKPGTTQSGNVIDFVRWGDQKNQKPVDMLQLVAQNHFKPQLLRTERDLLVGSRVQLFKRVILDKKIELEPVEDAQIEDWLDLIQADKLLMQFAYNFVYSGNFFAAFELDSPTVISAIRNFDFDTVRAKRMEKGVIPAYYVHGHWKSPKANDVREINAYDPADPVRFFEFMYHGRDFTPGQPYYDFAPWWGSNNWAQVSNLIPRYHISGLTKGYNIKYHIEIPKDYFKQFGDEAKQKEARAKLKEDMNRYLVGVDNVEVAFVTEFATDVNGKPLPGWKITPINKNLSDEAYTKLDNASNINHASAHGVDPSLAGIDTGGKLGGSGSEKRISYQLHLAMRTPVARKIILDPFNKVAKKIMGWPREYFLGIQDVDITTLDQNPTGQSNTANPNMPA